MGGQAHVVWRMSLARRLGLYVQTLAIDSVQGQGTPYSLLLLCFSWSWMRRTCCAQIACGVPTSEVSLWRTVWTATSAVWSSLLSSVRVSQPGRIIPSCESDVISDFDRIVLPSCFGALVVLFFVRSWGPTRAFLFSAHRPGSLADHDSREGSHRPDQSPQPRCLGRARSSPSCDVCVGPLAAMV